jgi:hypothetical protein
LLAVAPLSLAAKNSAVVNRAAPAKPAPIMAALESIFILFILSRLIGHVPCMGIGYRLEDERRLIGT